MSQPVSQGAVTCLLKGFGSFALTVLGGGNVDVLDAIGAGIDERLREELLRSDAVEVAGQQCPKELAEAIAANDSWVEVVVGFVSGSRRVTAPCYRVGHTKANGYPAQETQGKKKEKIHILSE